MAHSPGTAGTGWLHRLGPSRSWPGAPRRPGVTKQTARRIPSGPCSLFARGTWRTIVWPRRGRRWLRGRCVAPPLSMRTCTLRVRTGTGRRPARAFDPGMRVRCPGWGRRTGLRGSQGWLRAFPRLCLPRAAAVVLLRACDAGAPGPAARGGCAQVFGVFHQGDPLPCGGGQQLPPRMGGCWRLGCTWSGSTFPRTPRPHVLTAAATH